MKCIKLLIVILLHALGTTAQMPHLVEDIRSGTLGSSPTSLTAWGDKLAFSATDGTYGGELWTWQTWGSPATRLTDNGVITESGCLPEWRRRIPVYNNDLYYVGYRNATDRYLFRYRASGSLDTVYKLKNSNTLDYRTVAIAGNKMYYFEDSANTREILYSYNGVNPPVRIGGFRGVANASNWTSIAISHKGKYYFAADTSGFGVELLELDPATNMVKLAADIVPGVRSSAPRSFVVGGSKLYFTATDSAHGEELYSYDGTTVARLTDVVAGKGDGIPLCCNIGMAYHKGGIFFQGIANTTNKAAVYRLDTATGNVVKIVEPYPTAAGTLPQNFLSAPNNLHFNVNNSNPSSPGNEVWMYDGKNAAMMANLNPGSAAGVNSNLEYFKGYVYFSGNNGTTGFELYRVKDSAINVSVATLAGWPGSVTLHPNPTSTTTTLSITLQSPQSLRVVLTDMQGREVWASAPKSYPSGKHEQAIPMQNLAAGQYFYRLSDDKGQMLASGALSKQ